MLLSLLKLALIFEILSLESVYAFAVIKISIELTFVLIAVWKGDRSSCFELGIMRYIFQTIVVSLGSMIAIGVIAPFGEDVESVILSSLRD